MNQFHSAIYGGRVIHQRKRPKAHRLAYSVFSLLLDLDELPRLDRTHRLFGYNRRAPLSFFDRDHGPAEDRNLRPWVENLMRQSGIQPDGGAIRLLCYPRIFGYVFNPLSVFFCYRLNGELAATIYEVHNTFGERHAYVIAVDSIRRPVVRQSCEKVFHVSPFMDMEATYHFRILPPEGTVSIVIRQEDEHGLLLAANFAGRRQSLSDTGLFTCLLRYPLMTLKVSAAIHWQAVRMWLKGFPVFSHQPAPATVQSSVGAPSPTGTENG